jgi:hypothetical protein
MILTMRYTSLVRHLLGMESEKMLNSATSAFLVACHGVSEQMMNADVPGESKILRVLMRRASTVQV